VISEEREEINEKDQVKYKIHIIRNNQKKIRELKIRYKRYPLLHKGYGNYEELNVNLERHGKYTRTEIYLLRMNWNGYGYFPVCDTKLKIDNSFFNINVNSDNVKEVILRLLRELKDYIKDNECENALQYFPE